MSRYLIDRIRDTPSVAVWIGCEIEALHGDDKLEAVTIRGSDPDRRLGATAVFAKIGAAPRTDGLADFVGLDDRQFIATGEDARCHPSFSEHWHGADRAPLLLETAQRGVLAVGDVRSGSAKLVASAVGDGALVVRSIHDPLATCGARGW